MSSNISYFDYNATHPPFKEVLESNYQKYLVEYYNPSGSSRFSLKRQSAIEEVRGYIANLTKKKKESILFCSTGTEANHILLGYVFQSNLFKDGTYVSPFEHSSMYGALELFGIPYTIIKGTREGVISLDDLEEKMKSSPRPVITLLAANETGVIQPHLEIGKLCEKSNMPFLSDLMQAYCKLDFSFSHITGFTFSGHKIGGGMGAAVVCLPDSIKSDFKIFKGGNQENGNRAGTENSNAIENLMGASVLQLNSLIEKNEKLFSFKKSIEDNLNDLGATILSQNVERLPSTTFAILPIEDIDFVLMGLEEKGIIISTGSSCKSRAREASPSLLNMGYSKEEALRAIRVSTGYFTTEEEVLDLNKNINNLVKILA
jgi:cysteine desulfurase